MKKKRDLRSQQKQAKPKGLKALKAKVTASPALHAKAAYLARPLYARPADMHKLKERQTLRNEHLVGQEMQHKKNERERIRVMLNENMTPGLRATLIKNRDMLK